MKLPLQYSNLALLFFLLPFIGLGQTTAPAGVVNPHEKLLYVFGENWVTNNPEMVFLLEDCYQNRITFREEPASDKYPLLSTVPLMNKNNPAVSGADFQNFNPLLFNPFTYNIEFLSDKVQVFRVDGTNWVMAISPVIR